MHSPEDLLLHLCIAEIWGVAETPLLAWFNAETGDVVELLVDLDLDDCDVCDDLLLDD